MEPESTLSQGAEEADLATQDQDEWEPIPTSPKPSKIWLLVGGLVLILLAGAIGQWSGAGWFGHRSWFYGQGQLYVLNLGLQPLWVSVDGRERVEVPAENAEILEIVGGVSAVEVFDESGAPAGQYSVRIEDSHGFLKLTDEGCLVATDITRYYGGGGGAEDVTIVESFGEKPVFWDSGSKNLVWPRKPFPPILEAGAGPGIWVELVGCVLLEEPKYLQAYLHVRLQERVSKALRPQAPSSI